MSAIWVIAKNTFEEARHNRILYIGFVFFLTLLFISRLMGEVSIHQQVKVVKDIGLASISTFNIFVAIFVSVTSLYRDLNQRTIYSIVSKPIVRMEIVTGKYLGLVLMLMVTTLVMSLFLYFLLLITELRLDWGLVPAILLIWVESCIVAAIGMLFSSFSTPFLSGILTFGLFLVGRLSYELGQFGERSQNEVFKFFATGVQKVYDLESFNLRSEVVHTLPIYREDLVYPIFYGLFLSGVLVFGAVTFFSRRDFK